MTTALPWVFLPGWGMTAASLQPLREHLPGEKITLLEWPEDPECWRQAEAGNLDALLMRLAEQHPQPALWLGWSLGGLVAAKMAQHDQLKQLMMGLVTLGSGPWFVAGKDRPCRWGLNPAELKVFVRGFKKQPDRAWQHFLNWQSLGEPQGDRVLAQLQAQKSWPVFALNTGLQLLQQVEAAELIKNPSLPWLLVRGEDDPLCEPWSALQETYASEKLSWITLQACGHAPQFSESRELAEQLLAWSRSL
jgi:pimeloyl-[acyl-carrier protein] methyl ester esterase